MIKSKGNCKGDTVDANSYLSQMTGLNIRNAKIGIQKAYRKTRYCFQTDIPTILFKELLSGKKP